MPAILWKKLIVLYATITMIAVCRGDHLVTVLTTANEAYTKRRAEKGATATESYVVMPGRFFEGYVVDKTLEKTKLKDIAKTLAAGLKKSRYVPAKDVQTADLLLIVHWGVTIGNDRNRLLDIRDPHETEDLRRDYQGHRQAEINSIGSPTEDPALTPASGGYSRQFQEELDFKQLESSANIDKGVSTAQLLGFSSELAQDEHRAMASQRAKSLTSMLESDRYFIVVIAYDWQRWISEKKLSRLWTSRMSIASAGVNFSIAISRMNQAGANSFGTSNPELQILSTKKKQNDTVQAGELIFIGYQEEQPQKPTKGH